MTGPHLDPSRPNGHDQQAAPRFSTAEDVNPPRPGDSGYDEYARRRCKWRDSVEPEAEATPRVKVEATPYFDAGLGRRVTADDPAPEPEKASPTEQIANRITDL